MKSPRWILTATLMSATLAASVAQGAEPPSKPEVGIVIVYLGGPDAGGEGEKLIGQLVGELGTALGLPAGALVGSYFTENAPAVEKLRAQPSFVLGSLGFYLSQRASSQLVPLARLKTSGDAAERFRVLVQKGKYASLDDLKGKELHGSPLYEDPRFLDRIVFGGKLSAATHFALKPTARPLSAIRKVASGKVDAVLVNTMQYESLRRLPVFESLQEVFVSEPLPALGLMMVDSPRTRALQAKMTTTMLGLCGLPQGKGVCDNFGIAGFEPVDEAALEKVTTAYDAAP